MKKLLLTLGTVAAVAAPVASVIACGSNDSNKVPTIKLGHNEISFRDKGYQVQVEYDRNLGKDGTTPDKTTSGMLFSKNDPSKFTEPQQAEFLEHNFYLLRKTTQDNKIVTDNGEAIELPEPMSFWDKDMVENKFAANFINSKEITNVFTVYDLDSPGEWILGDATATLAHHTETEWKAQGASDVQYKAFTAFVVKHTPVVDTGAALTSTKTIAELQTAAAKTDYANLDEVAIAFGITLPTGVDGTTILKADAVMLSSIDPTDVELTIDVTTTLNPTAPKLVYKLTPKA